MTSSAARVLIADDQRDVVEALRLLLKAEAYQTDTADSPAAVRAFSALAVLFGMIFLYAPPLLFGSDTMLVQRKRPNRLFSSLRVLMRNKKIKSKPKLMRFKVRGRKQRPCTEPCSRTILTIWTPDWHSRVYN